MLSFKYQNDDNAPLVEITLSPHSTLTEVLEQFEAFLKAAGYCFDGEVDIVAVEPSNDLDNYSDDKDEIDNVDDTLN